jgi:hypothetical protein
MKRLLKAKADSIKGVKTEVGESYDYYENNEIIYMIVGEDHIDIGWEEAGIYFIAEELMDVLEFNVPRHH